MIIFSQASTGARSRPRPETELCVVHLIRHANGLPPFENFLDSYRRHPAGAFHQLALVLKGFDDEEAAEPYRALAADLCECWLSVPDDGFDLGAYHRAARMLPHRRLLFVNSFSIIQADNWLAQMASVASDPQVGAVAVSGSWGSQASHARYSVGLGGPYRSIFDDPLLTHQVFVELTSEQEQPDRGRGGSLRRHWQIATTLARHAISFAQFPSPHLRTNCFLIDRELWLRVCRRTPPNKLAAYRLESGRRSITNRITQMGLRVLVVGRDGRGYELGQWPQSNTFWQANQENLLISDNQTRAYQQGSTYTRLVLSRYAWGPQAAPTESQLPAVR
jgi:hypothetical protein